MTIIEHARRYLAKCEPSISGQGGHDQTFRVACVLVQEFGLSVPDSKPLMQEYSSRCIPPWSERDIDHKLIDAERQLPPSLGRGYRAIKRSVKHVFTDRIVVFPTAETNGTGKHYDQTVATELPAPIQNGTRELIKAVFEKGEGVRIAQAKPHPAEEGKEIPKDAGTTFSREEWLRKLDANGGDINRILKTSSKNGIFVTVNPMKIGGSKDSDVISYRHALVEWDDISKLEQWNIIRQSNIPCAAVIDSGNKSLHAWVKIDAKDRKEFDERVRLLYKHFEVSGCKLDEQNKNPSRLSRLPACERGAARQELLALNIGAESFTEWQIETEVDDLGQEFDFDKMLDFEPSEDPNCVLGDRWLCRGGSCLFIGQSGVGKSSFAMQAAISWGLGRELFGILPKKPLKSLFIQAENDFGDMAEMIQGVWKGIGLDRSYAAQVRQNVVTRKITTHIGFAFTRQLRRLIDKVKPDLVWIDPLLSYIGGDISKQEVCSEFLRVWLNPISEATGVIWMVMHHTNKPLADSKARKGWNNSDFAYMGTGSAELTNWARAVCVLQSSADDTYQMLMAKRGFRAGALDFNKIRSSKIRLAHSKEGICWMQVAEPEKKKKETGPEQEEFDLEGFLEQARDENFQLQQLVEAAAKYSGLSERTIKRNWVSKLKTRMVYDDDYKTWTYTK